mmetsp:Transcript_80635/g.261288  ORF Transcript_80635/g.261288 Transcript_80635/m.261288 type:complete len:200 (-) Transcript_80635:918-1517(-)
MTPMIKAKGKKERDTAKSIHRNSETCFQPFTTRSMPESLNTRKIRMRTKWTEESESTISSKNATSKARSIQFQNQDFPKKNSHSVAPIRNKISAANRARMTIWEISNHAGRASYTLPSFSANTADMLRCVSMPTKTLAAKTTTKARRSNHALLTMRFSRGLFDDRSHRCGPDILSEPSEGNVFAQPRAAFTSSMFGTSS